MSARPELCPDDQLLKLTQLADADTSKGLRRTETLLRSYGEDPRLEFLKGSLLAALQRYDEAVSSVRRAVELAPAFHVARFQLGLLLLTSGRPQDAADVWGPLATLAPGDSLRLFAQGLQHMARDEFHDAERLLREGIAHNTEHPPLNHDMQMVLTRMREASGSAGEESSSSAHWLLQTSASKPTQH